MLKQFQDANGKPHYDSNGKPLMYEVVPADAPVGTTPANTPTGGDDPSVADNTTKTAALTNLSGERHEDF